ncbi:hypothetical protein D3C77_642030 [compost metagenome]
MQLQATLFQLQCAQLVFEAFFTGANAFLLGGLRLLPFGGGLRGSTLRGSALLTGSSFARFGALLGGGGLAQAFGFQVGFSLFGLLFDLVKLIKLACCGGHGRQCEGGAQNNMLHGRLPQLFLGSGQVAFG